MPSLAISERRTRLHFRLTRAIVERNLSREDRDPESVLNELQRRRFARLSIPREHREFKIPLAQREFAKRFADRRIQELRMATAQQEQQEQQEEFMRKLFDDVRQGLKDDFDSVRSAIANVDAKVDKRVSALETKVDSRASVIEAKVDTLGGKIDTTNAKLGSVQSSLTAITDHLKIG